MLEARDVMQVLRQRPRRAARPAPEGAAPGRPRDRVRPRRARRRRLRASRATSSTRAARWRKMNAIIDAQGRRARRRRRRWRADATRCAAAADGVVIGDRQPARWRASRGWPARRRCRAPASTC
ncbi:MAG: hypothetical protein MZW92_12185 [Comamonadaceae bacterium]|nr:hypothetical protein [Comamonadaceae bacterium]